MLTKRARRLRQVADRLQWPENLWTARASCCTGSALVRGSSPQRPPPSK
ncbi:hypothetical protein [Streptomyces sp. NRRL S-813]|nr:hypothetical protein [Streptomyces sp. NRRL S-813]